MSDEEEEERRRRNAEFQLQSRLQSITLTDDERECVADLGPLTGALTSVQAFALAHILARALRRP